MDFRNCDCAGALWHGVRETWRDSIAAAQWVCVQMRMHTDAMPDTCAETIRGENHHGV
jgi:hypothetical protein